MEPLSTYEPLTSAEAYFQEQKKNKKKNVAEYLERRIELCRVGRAV